MKLDKLLAFIQLYRDFDDAKDVNKIVYYV